ncbi:DMT family transporter [Paenibacillus rhizoplanae]
MKAEGALAWVFLALAIVFELSGTVSMKLSHGLTRPWPSVLMFVFYGISFTSLSVALTSIKVGVAYAVWSGGRYPPDFSGGGHCFFRRTADGLLPPVGDCDCSGDCWLEH